MSMVPDQGRPVARKLAVVTALACLVAVGGGGASAWVPLRTGRPSPTLLLVVMVISVGVGIVASLLAAYLIRSHSEDGLSVHSLLGRAYPAGVVAVALCGLLGFSTIPLEHGVVAVDGAAAEEVGEGREGRLLRFLDDRSSPVRAGEGAGAGAVPTVLEEGAIPMIAVLLFGLVGSVIAFGWWLARRTREPDERPEEPVDTEAARGMVLRSIESMLADPDPDTAVIGAYARLLEGLEAAGVPRRHFEGPVEHLRRALARLRVRPDPLARLVGLFEVARFSRRALTVEDRDRALTALREVAADLGGEAAGVLGATASPGDRPR